MCMSTAYQVRNGENEIVADHVQVITTEDDTVKLTDIVGAETVVKGVLRSVDLNQNIIMIDAV